MPGTKNNLFEYNFAPPPIYQQEGKWVRFKRKLNSVFVNLIAGTPLQYRLYLSYWHYKLNNDNKTKDDVKKTHFIYLKPNYGAGIGHQLANWNAGLYFSGYYKLRFAHFPFSNDKWENFLGFGELEVLVSALNKKNFKTVNLPKFDSENQHEIDLIGKIIDSYTRSNVLFSLAMDQGYMRQFETTPILSEKFFAAPARRQNKLLFKPDSYTIAIHIRRRMSIETEEIWKSRGLDNFYYVNILKEIIAVSPPDKNITFYLFSQGTVEDFPEFKNFPNLIYCMDMGPVESFLHMVYADILVSSKSSFSYKPALISKGIKICPQTFWHGYPATEDFILADDLGCFAISKLSNLIKENWLAKR